MLAQKLPAFFTSKEEALLTDQLSVVFSGAIPELEEAERLTVGAGPAVPVKDLIVGLAMTAATTSRACHGVVV
jgi:hypothetical protein